MKKRNKQKYKHNTHVFIFQIKKIKLRQQSLLASYHPPIVLLYVICIFFHPYKHMRASLSHVQQQKQGLWQVWVTLALQRRNTRGLTIQDQPGMVAHAFNPNTLEAEASKSL